MKKLLLTLAALCLAFSLSAQKITDVIYLKNGSILRGKITEKTDSEIKLALKDGNIFVYQNADIERTEQIIKEPFFDFKTPVEEQWSYGASAGYLYSSAMWVNRNGAGQLFRVKADGKHGFTVGGVVNYRMFAGLGFGSGIKFSMGGFKYEDSEDETNYMNFSRYTIDIPVVANVYLGKERKWFVQAGLNASIMISGKSEVGEWWGNASQHSSGDILNPLSLQVVLGAGWGPVSAQLLWGITSVWSAGFKNDLFKDLLQNRTVVCSSPIGVSVSYTYMF